MHELLLLFLEHTKSMLWFKCSLDTLFIFFIQVNSMSFAKPCYNVCVFIFHCINTVKYIHVPNIETMERIAIRCMCLFDFISKSRRLRLHCKYLASHIHFNTWAIIAFAIKNYADKWVMIRNKMRLQKPSYCYTLIRIVFEFVIQKME